MCLPVATFTSPTSRGPRQRGTCILVYFCIEDGWIDGMFNLFVVFMNTVFNSGSVHDIEILTRSLMETANSMHMNSFVYDFHQRLFYAYLTVLYLRTSKQKLTH